MKAKAAFALLLQIVGGLLALPSILVLFFGALALKLLPWFPPFEQTLAWGVGLSFAAFVGYGLLKQSEVWRNELKAESTAEPSKERMLEARIEEPHGQENGA